MKIRICPKCLSNYDDSLNCCPKCQTRNPKYRPLYFLAVIIVITCILIQYLYFEQFLNLKKSITEKFSHEQITTSASKQDKTTNDFNKSGHSIEKINIRPMSELSYKSVYEILNMRKQYVNESPVFGHNSSYEPSENVFQIEDNLPWISAPQITKYGIENNHNIGEGISRHSLSINNPELLLAFLIPSYPHRPPESASEADYMIPKQIVWLKNKNVIHADFDLSNFFNKNPQYNLGLGIHLEDTNARDMGFNWIYCDKAEDIKFMTPDYNISTDIYELKGYYHKGFACRLESGCNNYSPNQPPLNFYIKRHGLLDCKLWKSKPLSKESKPDFSYMMVW